MTEKVKYELSAFLGGSGREVGMHSVCFKGRGGGGD